MSGAPGYSSYWSNAPSGSNAPASTQTADTPSGNGSSGFSTGFAVAQAAGEDANFSQGYGEATALNQSGQSPFNYGAGSVVNTSANPVTSQSGPIDASGGTGSYPRSLQNIVTQGLNDNIVSNGEFSIGSLTNLLRIGARGNVSAAAAPAQSYGPAPTSSSSTSSMGLVVLGVGVLALVLLLRK